MGRSGRHDHNVSGADEVCLFIDPHFRIAGLVQKNLVDPVAVKRNRITNPDLLDDDSDVRALFRHKRPDRVGPPVVRIGGISKWLQVEVSVQPHRHFPLRSINSIR